MYLPGGVASTMMERKKLEQGKKRKRDPNDEAELEATNAAIGSRTRRKGNKATELQVSDSLIRSQSSAVAILGGDELPDGVKGEASPAKNQRFIVFIGMLCLDS